MLLLSDTDVRALLTMPDAIDWMREAFTSLSDGSAQAPVRQFVEMPAAESGLLLMPSWRSSDTVAAVKLISLHDRNPERGRPRSLASVLVVDASNGDLLGLLDGEHLTAVRTGAASGLATDLLAREDSTVLVLFGGGRQAETQLEAVCAVRPIETVLVYTRSAASAGAFAERVSDRTSAGIIPNPPRSRITEGDIVCTATTSTVPVFDDDELGPGVHINGAGSYRPDMSEVPAQTVARSIVVVDQRGACMAEAGDLLQAVGHGFVWADVRADLGELVADPQRGRRMPGETTFFKSVGNAVQDLVAATRLLALAREAGVGREVQLR